MTGSHSIEVTTEECEWTSIQWLGETLILASMILIYCILTHHVIATEMVWKGITNLYKTSRLYKVEGHHDSHDWRQSRTQTHKNLDLKLRSSMSIEIPLRLNLHLHLHWQFNVHTWLCIEIRTKFSFCCHSVSMTSWGFSSEYSSEVEVGCEVQVWKLELNQYFLEAFKFDLVPHLSILSFLLHNPVILQATTYGCSIVTL